MTTFLILVLIVIAIIPFLIISVAGNTSENFHYVSDKSRITYLSINQPRSNDHEILPKSNSFCVNYDNKTRTINICGGMVDMKGLYGIINNSKVLNQTSPKNWVLNANISIAKGGTLFINSTDTDWLKINSTAGKAYSITTKGNLLIDKTKISSWNLANKTGTMSDPKEPRAYLIVPSDSTGQMNITNSNLSYLGYAGKEHTAGISYFSGAGSIISNSSFSFNYRGFYIHGKIPNIIFVNNTINNSNHDGLVANINSTNLQIHNNAIYNNVNDGIFCSGLCKNISIISNAVYNNTGNGIFLNQSAINSNIRNNLVYDNGRSGITLFNSSKSVIANNRIDGNLLGILITRMSHNNAIQQNIINGSLLNGISLYEQSYNNIFHNNIIRRSIGTGIYVQGKGTSNNIFIKNNITNGDSYGFQFLIASNNILQSNMVSKNSNNDYYAKSGSTNTIIDTTFNNGDLGVLDDNSQFIIKYTDNRINRVSDKTVSTTAYPNGTSLLVTPRAEKMVLNTFNMNVIPFSNYINVSALNDDFNYNKTYKKWSTISPPSLPVRTKYMIGGFEPNTQIAVNINGSFWNAYTSNSSGYISFIYDEDGGSRYPSLKRFEANADNKAALVSILLLAVIAMVLIALFVVVRRHKREKKIAEITSVEKWSKTENKIPPK